MYIYIYVCNVMYLCFVYIYCIHTDMFIYMYVYYMCVYKFMSECKPDIFTTGTQS